VERVGRPVSKSAADRFNGLLPFEYILTSKQNKMEEKK
jgi:hypothetical protein